MVLALLIHVLSLWSNSVYSTNANSEDYAIECLLNSSDQVHTIDPWEANNDLFQSNSFWSVSIFFNAGLQNYGQRITVLPTTSIFEEYTSIQIREQLLSIHYQKTFPPNFS